MGLVSIAPGISLGEEELEFSYSRSSGPGGQHVNKSNTKVTLTWSLEANTTIPVRWKDYLSMRLGTHLKENGEVVIQCDQFRSQERNKKECVDRLRQLLARAAKVPKARKKTRPSKAAKEKRLKQKRAKSEKKQWRQKLI